MATELDRLTSQLNYLPAIIGRMGLNIAEAQQAFNADYVRTITNLLILMNAARDESESSSLSDSILKELAPSRYQFTESTIDFSADLAESLDLGASVGVGFGMAGFVINASASVAFGYDYRASARITSTLHAIPADREFGAKLLARAKEIKTEGVELPDRTAMEEMVWAELDKLRQVTKSAGLGDPPTRPADT